MQNEMTELQNQVRTLKRIVYGFGCLLVSGIVVSATSLQTVPDLIQAKRFEVVNGDGKVIVELSNLIGGGVDNGMLVTRTSKGQTLVELSAGLGGGIVTTNNGQGQTLVALGSNMSGNGDVMTYDNEGNEIFSSTYSSIADPELSPSIVPPTKVDTSNAIDATTISDDFENNQLAAETKYTNLGAFFVTGNFHEYGDKIVDKDNEYHYDVITLDVGPWNKVVIFGLTREYIETLNKGDEVTFKVKFLTLQMIMDHPVFEVVE